MAPNDLQALDTIFHQITTANNPNALNHTLRNTLPKDSRELILAGPLSSGQDPLQVLDMRINTLGALYIIPNPPPWEAVLQFCSSFMPDHARVAPDRVSMLARGISRLAEHLEHPSWAIEPLYNLLTRYAYDPSYLTPIHHIFVLQCITTKHFSAALPLLAHPITSISTSLCPDLTYNDNLLYHYTAGIALTALKKWEEAEEYFEICVTSPGSVPAALQLEALKKLRLVQLISKGQVSPLPKYTHPLLLRALKNNAPYTNFINAYPSKTAQLNATVDKERSLFIHENNLGLINQAIARAPRWALKKLTATYVTLALTDIGKEININDEEELRSLILSMIEASDISAQISADGTVTFSDPLPEFTQEQVDKVLHEAQVQSAMLNELEMEMARSREYLSKALKGRDGDWGGPSMDEEYGTLGNIGNIAGPGWAEDAMFS